MSSWLSITSESSSGILMDTAKFREMLEEIESHFLPEQEQCRKKIYDGFDNKYYGHIDLVDLDTDCFNLFAYYCEKAKLEYFKKNVITQKDTSIPIREKWSDYSAEEQRNLYRSAILNAWDELLSQLKQDPRYDPKFKA